MPANLKHLAADGATQLTSKNWGDAIAGVGLTPVKFAIENVGDRASTPVVMSVEQVPDNDGYGMFRIAVDTATVIPPYSLTAALSGAGAGGVWATAGIKGYVVCAINALGQTTKSVEVTITVDVLTKKMTVGWHQVPNATGYEIYRTDSPGTYDANSLRTPTPLGAGQSSYIDDGNACGAGTPPATNTTGGASPAYGTPPTMGLGPLNVGVLAIGQQWHYWVNRVIPSGTAESGNPRLSLRRFTET